MDSGFSSDRSYIIRRTPSRLAGALYILCVIGMLVVLIMGRFTARERLIFEILIAVNVLISLALLIRT